jgi:cell wall-associated NlpC family hydrolase
VPSDTVEAADVTVNPAAAPYVSADPPLQHQDPDVATEPREADVAPHPDISPASASLQDVESLPDADKVPADPPTEPTAQLVHASASNLAYDIAKEAAIVGLIDRYSGTPYIWGGDSPRGTDCSGLASWLANAATGRPIFGDRFDTSTEESALLARGFQYGTAPGALVIGWNDHHTAVTLADGTPAASGEGGGVRFGGGGAYQAQFNHHMYLPITPRPEDSQPAAPDGAGL